LNVEVLNQKQYTVSRWSGGDTTELYIYPKDGSYTDRNFSFRISTATVDKDTSVFTKLPGIQRKLMVLNGSVRLDHNGIKGKCLQPGDQEAFLGEWDTKSEGIVRDFNLMTTASAEGMLTLINLPSGEKENIALCRQDPGKYFLLLYLPGSGQITLSDGYTKYLIKEKETLAVEVGKEDGVVGVIIENTSQTTVQIIKTEVSVTG